MSLGDGSVTRPHTANFSVSSAVAWACRLPTPAATTVVALVVGTLLAADAGVWVVEGSDATDRIMTVACHHPLLLRCLWLLLGILGVGVGMGGTVVRLPVDPPAASGVIAEPMFWWTIGLVHACLVVVRHTRGLAKRRIRVRQRGGPPSKTVDASQGIHLYRRLDGVVEAGASGAAGTRGWYTGHQRGKRHSPGRLVEETRPELLVLSTRILGARRT